MGKGYGGFSHKDWRYSDHAALAHPARTTTQIVLVSKIYRQMYADTGIATDSARISRSSRWARWLAKPCQRLFAGPAMPHLKLPEAWSASTSVERSTCEVAN